MDDREDSGVAVIHQLNLGTPVTVSYHFQLTHVIKYENSLSIR